MDMEDYECEPMDVDLSCNSTHPMDISYNDSVSTSLDVKIKKEPCDSNFAQREDINIIDDKNETVAKSHTIIKRFSLNMPPPKTRMYRLSNTMLSIIFTILAVISLATYHIVNFQCSKELDLKVLRQSFSENVIGQAQAIDDIMTSLEEKSHSKILLLYGGTGVGKTYTISLLLENLYHYANVYHYTMPSFVERFSTDVMVGFTLCPNSFIVVDDLGTSDMYVKEHIMELIKKSDDLNKNITVILVFNCDTINERYVKKCDYSFYAELKEAFNEINASKQFIRYNPLTEEHLKQCIIKELNSKNLPEAEFQDILKNFNVTIDGCKGVHTKIKMLGIS